MSIFRQMVEGFAQGFLQGGGLSDAPGNGAGYRERGRIERLCHENGWDVDARDGEDRYLFFHSPFAEHRSVVVGRGDEALVVFTAMSFTVLPPQVVPPEVLGYLLQRNEQIGLGAWRVSETDDEKLAFLVSYVAIGCGLTAGLFKHICETINQEANEFDVKMRRAGLL
jgi:hypothetical protein